MVDIVPLVTQFGFAALMVVVMWRKIEADSKVKDAEIARLLARVEALESARLTDAQNGQVALCRALDILGERPCFALANAQ